MLEWLTDAKAQQARPRTSAETKRLGTPQPNLDGSFSAVSSPIFAIKGRTDHSKALADIYKIHVVINISDLKH